jgi:hypothetical protein
MNQGQRLAEIRRKKRDQEKEDFLSKNPELNDNPDALETAFKKWRRSQRISKAVVKETEKRAKDAEAAAKKAAAKSKTNDTKRLTLEEEAFIAGREALADHPLFGSAVIAGSKTVKLYREPSGEPIHNIRGVTPGFLEDISFDTFTEALVKNRHGGGCFKAKAVDGMGRTLASTTFTISGKAKKPIDIDEDDDDGDKEGPSIVDLLTRQQDQEQSFWSQRMYEENARLRNEARDTYNNEEERFERTRSIEKERQERDMIRQQEREDRKYRDERDRRERERESDRQRTEDMWKMQQASAQQQMQMFTAMMQSQQSNMQTLVTVLTKNKGDDGGVRAMGEVMGSISGIYTSLVDTIQASVSGEDNRSTAERMLTTLANAGAPFLERVADSMGGAPTPGAQSQVQAQDQPVSLPDGRTMNTSMLIALAQQFGATHGRQPTEEEVMMEAMRFLGPIPVAQIAAPQPEPTITTSSSLLVEIEDAYNAKGNPLEVLDNLVTMKKLSTKDKLALGEVYQRKSPEGLMAILTESFVYLKGIGVEAPASFLGTFQRAKEGPDWLETFLYACTFDTVEEAKAQIIKDATEAVEEQTS